MTSNRKHSCKWTIDDLREQIAGINIEVPVLDGSTARYVFLDNGASTPSFRHVIEVMSEFTGF